MKGTSLLGDWASGTGGIGRCSPKIPESPPLDAAGLSGGRGGADGGGLAESPAAGGWRKACRRFSITRLPSGC